MVSEKSLAALADRLVYWAAVVLLLTLLAVVVLGVFFRQINQPLAWSDELAQYLLVWTGFVGWIIAARRRSHIRIMVFAEKLPRPVQAAMHVERQPRRPPPPQTVAANVVRPAAASSLGFSSLGGAGMPSLAPPVPIARAAAATLPPGMAR